MGLGWGHGVLQTLKMVDEIKQLTWTSANCSYSSLSLNGVKEIVLIRH